MQYKLNLFIVTLSIYDFIYKCQSASWSSIRVIVFRKQSIKHIRLRLTMMPNILKFKPNI